MELGSASKQEQMKGRTDIPHSSHRDKATGFSINKPEDGPGDSPVSVCEILPQYDYPSDKDQDRAFELAAFSPIRHKTREELKEQRTPTFPNTSKEQGLESLVDSKHSKAQVQMQFLVARANNR
jgi:hypothetical protein